MKTKEFIKRVKSLRFEVEIMFKTNEEIGCILIKDEYGQDFVRIWSTPYAISTIDDGFNTCKNSEELYELCFEYAATPVDERQENL